MTTKNSDTYKSFIYLYNFLPIFILMSYSSLFFANNFLSILFIILVFVGSIYLELKLRKNDIQLLKYYHHVLLRTLLWFLIFCAVMIMLMTLARDPNATGGTSNNSITIIFIVIPLTFISYIVLMFIVAKKNKKVYEK